jgi:polar amino acid transport system substrate-binding protein
MQEPVMNALSAGIAVLGLIGSSSAALADGSAETLPVVRFGTGQSLMPYTIEETQSGLELDIVREAMQRAGYRIEVEFFPMARVAWALQTGKVDAAMPMAETAGLDGICYSASHIRYQNVAVTLGNRGVNLDRVADLQDKDVVAFQYARKYLGSEFGAMADSNPRYREIAHQDQQVEWLYTGATEVIVLDINIFRFQQQQLRASLRPQAVAIHPLFSPNDYKVGFRDRTLCDAFNVGLAAIRADGSYQAIQARYFLAE